MDSLGNGLYRVILYYYAETTLFPERANVWVSDALVGLHHNNWDAWNKVDDPSKSDGSTWSVNTRIEVYNNAGIKIYGNAGATP